MYHSPNPDRQLVCCLTCGSDTRHKSSVCKKCRANHEDKPEAESEEDRENREAELPIDILDGLLDTIEGVE
jgi:hypothetical protein